MNNNVGRIIKRPKIYFMDTGLACYLTGYVSSETLEKSANPSMDAIKNFYIVDKFKMDSPNGIVLCLTENIHPINDKNYIVPIEYI